ncbi:MAG TPA: carboxypeptidase regulatory-like domain-containing protein [Thermoplasmata archaeon]|nr:carboxypeptidase regulatory-like domain-containing protein [Thermoplasmata archaeon]
MQLTSEWWRRNGWTVAILLSAFAAAFAIRTVWTYPIVQQWGALYTYAGGSDSYYHSRVMTFIIQTHTNLVHDPLLKFPLGENNPREPLFDWMNAVLGIVFAPLFGGNAVNAGAWFLDFQGPFWAALSVFPVYLIGKEVSSRRMGLMAAVIFPFIPASIDSSIFGYANYLSFYTFIILVVLYSWIRTVKAAGTRRYVGRYRDRHQIVAGLRAFFVYERPAVKWAVFTGVGLGALALAWQGYTYGVVVIALSVLVLTIAERIRRVDSFSLYVSTWIVGLVGFPMAIPYYVVQQQFVVWFELPLLLFFGVLVLLLPFVMMRDTPWVISIPALAGFVLLAAAALAVISPSNFSSIVTGQGYFVKNLIYSTVAEAQAPSIDQLVISYGVITFFLAFVGIALFVYQLARNKFPRAALVFLIFSLLSVALPISAAKFFLLGAPVFALLPAEALRRALDVAGYPELRRTVASLSDRRSQLSAFRRAFKIRHVLVLVVVVGLLLPNIWLSIDAGIPGNTKGQFATQVQNSLPSYLQPNPSIGSAAYFGAAGTSLDTPDQYDSAGYNWLATQDTALPPPTRPAFVSWWDYGFQAIDQGQHPSVADNFQNGIDPAGQFLLAQNQSLAIGVLSTTLLQAEQTKSGDVYLPSALNSILAADGVNVGQLHNYLVNESNDLALVLNHPERYLPVDPNTITADNAMYLVVSYYLASSLTVAGISQVYNDLQSYTGWTIRYDMTDSRLIPFSGQDTGIFYAPADLTGRVINGAGLPTSFFNVTVLGSDGNTYPLGQVPATVSPINYTVNYFPPFYQSMIYRTYFGYNGSQIGQQGGIPGLSSNLATSPVEPGWMLSHFEVVYQTAFYCPTKADDAANTNCLAENTPTALAMAKAVNGSVANTSAIRYFEGGESMLEYYPGETMIGTVQLPDGTPVTGVRVTVSDQWGIPHMTTFTGASGNFSLVLPPGNDTVNITTGTLQGLSQQGNILIRSLKVYVPPALGLNLHPPTLVQSINVGGSTVAGTVYWNVANNTTFVPTVDPVIPGAQAVLWGPNGLAKVSVVTDQGGTFDLPQVTPGVYNYSILYDGRNFTESQVFVHPNTFTNASAGIAAGVVTGNVTTSQHLPIAGARVTIGNSSGAIQSYLTNSTGRYTFTGLGPGNYTVSVVGPEPPLGNVGQTVTISTVGQTIQLPLELVPMSQVQYVVEANGGGVANIPVRFVPLPDFSNASLTPIGALQQATGNATTFVSGPTGLVTASLPVGNYSVYALGYVGSSLDSAVSSTAVFPGLPSELNVLALQPSAPLSGTVAVSGQAPSSTDAAVLVYAGGESEVTVWANASHAYSVVLPVGQYSVLAIDGSPSASSTTYAAIAPASLTYATTLNLAAVPALTSRFTVGATLPSGTFFPAAAATVSVSAGFNGPTISTLAGGNGTAAFVVPATLPITAGSYCVQAASAGFSSMSSCAYSPGGLASLRQVPLTLTPVPVTLKVLGLPSGTSVTINLSATSISATTVNLTGGPTFSFSTTPGAYTLSARAVIGNGTVIYIPSQVLSTTIPLGAAQTALTLVVVPAVNSTGTLTLPAGATASTAVVSLSSPLLNLTVNGSAFTSTGFRAAPGTYAAHATVSVGGENFTGLTNVTVSSSGRVTPAISVQTQAAVVQGTIRNLNGSALSLSPTVRFVGPQNATLYAQAVDGNFSISLPVGTLFQVTATATALVTGSFGEYFATYTTPPNTGCTSSGSPPVCVVPMVPHPDPVWLNGTLSSPGQPPPLAGTVSVVGPYPSTNQTILSASGGNFSLRVAPGVYSVYATAGGSAHPLAVLTRLVAVPGAPTASLVLTSTYTAILAVNGPNGTASGLAPATVILRAADSSQVEYTDVVLGSAVQVALPIGTYTVVANSSGTSHGLLTNATALTRFSVLAGNVAVNVSLAYQYSQSVSATLVGPQSAAVAGGGTATFQFTIRNVGNLPVTVHPVGSPSYWSFSFSVGNVTLTPGPGGNVVTVEVTIKVPVGTVVAHPLVVIDLDTGAGVPVGVVAPAPVVNVYGYLGLQMGPSPTLPSEVSLATALVPFYVTNNGNAFELVNLTIVNLLRLNALGWNAQLVTLPLKAVTGPVGADAGSNTSYYVNLTAMGPIFLPPGSVTVAGSVLNASGGLQVTISVPVPTVNVRATSTSGGPQVVITGPNIGPAPSSLPTWVIPVLVFVPAIALAVGLSTWRWWRTRRWTRR